MKPQEKSINWWFKKSKVTENIAMSLMNRLKTHWTWLLLSSVTFLLGFAIFLYISPKWQWADWTGFGEDSNLSQEELLQNGKLTVTKRITHFQSGKTLWDWLGLAGVIAIPIVLFQLQGRQQEIAYTNLREEALQDYIDKIAELLIDKELKVLLKQLIGGTLTKDDPKLDAALDIVRARTLSILRRLDGDGERKSSVVYFLFDAELLQGLDLLKDANFSGANLLYAELQGANLSGVNLKSAKLSGANLSDISLREAKLSGADLKGAYLWGANLSGANLSGADLKGAYLLGANLSGAFLLEANLSGAVFEDANLKGANLKGANLKNVKGLTLEQIKGAQAWEKADYDPDFREQLRLPRKNTP